MDVALIGVEPGLPGEPAVIEGSQLLRDRSNDVIVDTGVTERLGLGIGDTLRIKVTQGTEEEFYDLTIVGVTDRRQYFFQPAVFVPLLTWDKIKPQGTETAGQGELVSNIAVVRLQEPAGAGGDGDEDRAGSGQGGSGGPPDGLGGHPRLCGAAEHAQHAAVLHLLHRRPGRRRLLPDSDAAEGGADRHAQGDRRSPTGRWAGPPSSQIVTINAIGVAIGAVGTLALVANFPVNVPIMLTGPAALTSVLALLLIGPLGGIVSVFVLLRIEPLRALGLAQ